MVNRSHNNEVSISGYETATLSCNAVSDDSTVITYTWYRDDSSRPIVVDNRTYRSQREGRLLLIDPQRGDASRISGVYRCVADNGYSSDAAVFRLSVNGRTFHLRLLREKSAIMYRVAQKK